MKWNSWTLGGGCALLVTIGALTVFEKSGNAQNRQQVPRFEPDPLW